MLRAGSSPRFAGSILELCAQPDVPARCGQCDGPQHIERVVNEFGTVVTQHVHVDPVQGVSVDVGAEQHIPHGLVAVTHPSPHPQSSVVTISVATEATHAGPALPSDTVMTKSNSLFVGDENVTQGNIHVPPKAPVASSMPSNRQVDTPDAKGKPVVSAGQLSPRMLLRSEVCTVFGVCLR